MADRRTHGGGYVPPGSQAAGQQNTQTFDVYGAPRVYGGGQVPLDQARNNGSPSNAHGGGYDPNRQQQMNNLQGNPGQQPQNNGWYVPSSYDNTPRSEPAQTYQGQGNYTTTSYQSGPTTSVSGYSQSYNPATAEQNIPSEGAGPSTSKRDAAVAFFRLSESRGITDTLPGFDQHHRTLQRGSSNNYHPLNSWRFKYPSSFQMPQLRFRSTDSRRHRDIMQRVYEGLEDDRYLSPRDGHLAKLVVQASQDVYDGAANSTWRRTFVRNISPTYIRLANWPLSTVPTKSEHWTGNDWMIVCAKWLPTCAGMLFVLLINPNGQNGKLRNGGFYDAFSYKHWGYPKTARNFLENPPSDTPQEGGDLANNRVLGPRYLCLLKKKAGVSVVKTDDSMANVQYIFIGYSTKQFNNSSDVDMNDLHTMAETAAREAKVQAFWVAGSCMPEAAEMEQDVYRISDVMRGAQSLVIIVGPEPTSPSPQTRETLLRSWGTRMWTLPEALLSPSDTVKIYTRGHDGPPLEVSKKQFAAVVWNDPLISRQLIDHYARNLDLSRLELVTIALKCLSNRERGEYFEGDLSYALMGLLRQRPKVDSSDSAFLAFARLSMAGDSDMLLERLICTLPKDHTASWLSMDDTWDCNLWDIYPTCQVAGIGPGDTVILDGAFGAAIRWKAFAPVFYIRQDSWSRIFTRITLHGVPAYFLIGIILTSLGGTAKPIGIILVVLAVIVLLASPYLTRVVYQGKLWGTQAWFQGFEGYMDLATIESHIFGAYMGRLKWSTAGSPLCCHSMNKFGECVGLDPILRPEVREMVENAVIGGIGSLKVFTLIDTYTMTVTMFAAVRPPVAVLLCGREGGMQRAVMCSYDWATQTLFRETVLRMETPILERMFRVNRFRFGLQRPPPDVQ